jgi:hypothetical protein
MYINVDPSTLQCVTHARSHRSHRAYICKTSRSPSRSRSHYGEKAGGHPHERYPRSLRFSGGREKKSAGRSDRQGETRLEHAAQKGPRQPFSKGSWRRCLKPRAKNSFPLSERRVSRTSTRVRRSLPVRLYRFIVSANAKPLAESQRTRSGSLAIAREVAQGAHSARLIQGKTRSCEFTRPSLTAP